MTQRTKQLVDARLSRATALMVLSLSGCGPDSGEQEHLDLRIDPVVYGADNRRDVYDHPSEGYRELARSSVVALMSASDIDVSDPSNVQFAAATLGEVEDLCPDQRFRDDPTPAFCSGTLIADDLVLTAGHCIDASDCSSTRFVFGFYRDTPTTLQGVTTDDVFSCAEVVARKQGHSGGLRLDYAVVRLDRAATPLFEPARVRHSNNALHEGERLAVIGFPSGIPAKIDTGGKVRTPRKGERDFFVATTDTFGGNSGSGVFERDSAVLVGILVRGATDYVKKGDCRVVKECSPSGCAGEESTYAFRALQGLCAAQPDASLCTE